MAFNEKNSRFNHEKIGAELRVMHKDKVLQFGNDNWKIDSLLGGGYLYNTSAVAERISRGAVTLCRASNGVERKYAVVRMFYTQPDVTKLYIMELVNTVDDGITSLEKHSIEVVRKLDIPEELKLIMEGVFRDKLEEIRKSLRKGPK